MAEDQEERTEEATQTRRDEFRRRGQVAHSREVASAAVILVAAVGISGLSQFFLSQLFELFQRSFGLDLVTAVREGDFWALTKFAGTKFAILVAPVFGVFAILSVLSVTLQIGFLQVEDALQPKLERINPLNGLGRLFSLKGLVEGFKAALKLGVMSLITYLVLRKELQNIPGLLKLSLAESGKFLGHVLFKLLFSLGLGVVAIAVLDYFFQRWDLERQMRMTKEEVKQENKNQQGDPLIKARIRKIQRQAASRKMLQDVPKADVIVTNPTHIACALKYSADLPAPQLIAKGGDLMAEKIKEIAREHGIPVVENKPLARTIFKTLKIGQIIPRELYVAVAEVLSYVYKLKRRKKGTPVGGI